MYTEIGFTICLFESENSCRIANKYYIYAHRFLLIYVAPFVLYQKEKYKKSGIFDALCVSSEERITSPSVYHLPNIRAMI